MSNEFGSVKVCQKCQRSDEPQYCRRVVRTAYAGRRDVPLGDTLRATSSTTRTTTSSM